MPARPDAVDTQRSPTRPPLQEVVFREYLQLQQVAASRFSASLAGRLIVCAGFGPQGEELSLATTIAGGVFLGIEPDAGRVKTAIRNVTCDFLVNTFDEALRALKNEVRKRKPLSVGLLSEIPSAFNAMVEVGVQPDLIATTIELAKTSKEAPERRLGTQANSALRQLVLRGAIKLNLDDAAHEDSRYVEIIWSTGNLADLRRLDRAVLAWLQTDDTVRRRWLEQVGGAFHRHLPLERVMGVRPGEFSALLDALRSAAPFSSTVSARWCAPNGALQTADL